MGEMTKKQIPGQYPALSLGIVAVLTCVFPIISLPCSITGFFQARAARRYIAENKITNGTVAKVSYYLNLIAIVITATIIVVALPAAIERNLV